MRPITFTMNLDNQSATKIALGQQLASAGNLVLTAAASAIDSSGSARYILFTTTEDDSAKHYTITGKDADGNSITEGPTTLPNSSTKASTKAYASISQIAIDAAIGANMSVGTTNTTATAISKTIPMNFYSRIAPQVSLEITGTETLSVLETFDDILGSGTSTAVFQAAPSGLTSQSSTTHAQADVATTGLQIKVVSYTNGATLTVRIVQPSNSNLG